MKCGVKQRWHFRKRYVHISRPPITCNDFIAEPYYSAGVDCRPVPLVTAILRAKNYGVKQAQADMAFSLAIRAYLPPVVQQ